MTASPTIEGLSFTFQCPPFDALRLSLRPQEAARQVATGLALPDDDIGASAPALAIASGAHETQYTRLFRS